MKAVPWFRRFVCGLSIGGLMSFPQSLPADDPSVNDERQTSPDAKSSQELPGSEAAFAKILFGNLSAEHMKSLGEMLEKDWKDRPEWGEMAVAILKDDFMRPGTGWWKPSAKRYDWKWLSERFDANKDGKVEQDELPKDIAKLDQLFARLDRDSDEQLVAADFEDADPMKSQMSNRLFDKFDFDSNGRVTQQEVSEFFRRADKDKSEFLTPDDWWLAIDPPSRRRTSGDADAPAMGPSSPNAALRMLMRGELGWLTSGPQVGDVAPDFTLPKHDGTANVKLSDSFGKRPVVLVFGSFT